MFKTTLKWYSADKMPVKNKRIMVYSSGYVGKDVTMVFRLLDSSLFKYVSEADYWTYLPIPINKGETL